MSRKASKMLAKGFEHIAGRCDESREAMERSAVTQTDPYNSGYAKGYAAACEFMARSLREALIGRNSDLGSTP